MKKTLAIVLALVMVLAMIPAMSADVTEYKTITDKSYVITTRTIVDGVDSSNWKTHDKGNTVELKYNWEDLKEDQTGKWSEDAKMAEIAISGWDTAFNSVASDKITATIDGKELSIAEDADYYRAAIWENGSLKFPIEVTKAGYTDTFVVQMVATVNDVKITETAKITIKCINTAEYKDIKTAVITNIVPSDSKLLDAYIVGSKLYLDFVKDADTSLEMKVTFADENKAAFTGITYAYSAEDDTKDIFEVADGDDYEVTTYTESYKGWEGEAVRLEKSAANYVVTNADAEDVTFKLETKSDLYETKEYDVVVRTSIAKEDPKGIYFAETTKTIAMGQTYAPAVLGVKTGKPVAATIYVGDKDNATQTDHQVIDIDEDGNVVGTREGIAYITAEYTHYAATGDKTYTSSSMKIVVTLPGESIPALDPAVETYYVTCRALNVRAGAGTSYKKVDLIHRGDAVKVVELKNGWAKLDDGTYVCAKYISK